MSGIITWKPKERKRTQCRAQLLQSPGRKTSCLGTQGSSGTLAKEISAEVRDPRNEEESQKTGRRGH